jgi:Asp-tRNA(Asn)/Glu-tRNA(Gln) amidotransferase B subunit
MFMPKRKEPEEFVPRFEEEPVNLEAIVDEVINHDTTALLEIQCGLRRPLQKLISEAMRKSGGKADPHKIRRLILDKISPSE